MRRADGAESAESEWAKVADQFLPLRDSDSPWRHNRSWLAGDAERGWKLHVSATVLSAVRVLRRIGPFLRDQGVAYKGPATLRELAGINCGLLFGYEQVGKCITVYPRSDAEALLLGHRLHALVGRIAGPEVPFETTLYAGSRVSYRYGSFVKLELDRDGAKIYAMRSPEGTLIPDVRGAQATLPSWARCPFPPRHKRRTALTPLNTRFLTYEALTQRGKGGVYRALDLEPVPARLCILKEGRRHGETSWDGKDGASRTRHEAGVLRRLRQAGVRVPAVYDLFSVSDNAYLAIENIDGHTLQDALADGPPELDEVIRYSIGMAEVLDTIHDAGWVWRDCKPANFVLEGERIRPEIRPIDFEGSCLTGEPQDAEWASPGYLAPEGMSGPAAPSGDIYALGASIHQLLTGSLVNPTPLPLLADASPGVPTGLRRLVDSMLDSEPGRRPSALKVRRELRRYQATRQTAADRMD